MEWLWTCQYSTFWFYVFQERGLGISQMHQHSIMVFPICPYGKQFKPRCAVLLTIVLRPVDRITRLWLNVSQWRLKKLFADNHNFWTSISAVNVICGIKLSFLDIPETLLGRVVSGTPKIRMFGQQFFHADNKRRMKTNNYCPSDENPRVTAKFPSPRENGKCFHVMPS